MMASTNLTASHGLHAALAPRWERVEDVGSAGAVSRYSCEGCGRFFRKEEGERPRDEASRRLVLGGWGSTGMVARTDIGHAF